MILEAFGFREKEKKKKRRQKKTWADPVKSAHVDSDWKLLCAGEKALRKEN
jgi:hypothetical protein